MESLFYSVVCWNVCSVCSFTCIGGINTVYFLGKDCKQNDKKPSDIWLLTSLRVQSALIYTTNDFAVVMCVYGLQQWSTVMETRLPLDAMLWHVIMWGRWHVNNFLYLSVQAVVEHCSVSTEFEIGTELKVKSNQETLSLTSMAIPDLSAVQSVLCIRLSTEMRVAWCFTPRPNSSNGSCLF